MLYIDDSPSNLKLMIRILGERPKVSLLTASSGSDGIRLATERTPDLILLDLHLPDMSGETVLHRLWEQSGTRAIPTVILSADASAETSARLLQKGATGYLEKPVHIDKLLRLVDQLVQPGDWQ